MHRFEIGQQRVSLNQLRKCLRLAAELTHIEDAVRIARHEIKGFHLHLPRAGFAGTQSFRRIPPASQLKHFDHIITIVAHIQSTLGGDVEHGDGHVLLYRLKRFDFLLLRVKRGARLVLTPQQHAVELHPLHAPQRSFLQCRAVHQQRNA